MHTGAGRRWLENSTPQIRRGIPLDRLFHSFIDMPSAVATNTPELSAVTNVLFITDPNLVGTNDIVELSADLFGRLFPEESNKDKFVLIKLLGSECFELYKLYKVGSIDDIALNLIKFINHPILDGYSLDELTLNQALVRSVLAEDIPILSQIYVSVPENIYDILHDKPQTLIRQQFKQFLEASGGLVNDGDLLRLINGHVRLCEPVSLGFVDANTVIILIKDKPEPSSEIDDEEEPELVDDDEDLDVLSYMANGLMWKATKPSKPFTVKPLPHRIGIDGIPTEWDQEDSELFVFLSPSDYIGLGFPVFNGDLVKLVYGETSLVVKLFTLTEPNRTFARGLIYLLPILLINLGITGKGYTVHLEQWNDLKLLLSETLPVAESVIISRVASQITMDRTFQNNFFSSLKTLLSHQFRCVQKGDFLAVTIDSVLAKTMFDTAAAAGGDDDAAEDHEPDEVIPQGEPDAVAWFKIVDLKGVSELPTQQFIIDPNRTLFVSLGVEFIRLPPNDFVDWYSYLQLPPLFNFSSKSVLGEFGYASELKKIVDTNLNSPVNLRTSVLLTLMLRGIGKTTAVRNVCAENGLNLIELDCYDLINPGQELKTIGVLSGKIDKIIGEPLALSTSFHVIYLKHIEALCPHTDPNDQNSNMQTLISLKVVQTLGDYLSKYSNLMVLMSCNDQDKLNENVLAMVKFTIEVGVPSERERFEIFRFLIGCELTSSDPRFSLRNDVLFQTLALQLAGLTPRDLISIIKMAKKLALLRLAKVGSEIGMTLDKLIAIGNGGVIQWIPEDFAQAINEARNQFSDSIGAPRIPTVKWEDVGGMDFVKGEILDTIDMPLKHPELFQSGVKKRSGILFYGPPGTGKTLLAKAIATNFSLNFFSVKGPELLNMYIGESEANVRRVFQRARDAKPCVIFFDELDSVAPKRGNQGDSGGVMDRIVSQLLAELDGMSGGDGDGVFVVGATNRPDLLDEALLRPGRFDKLLYLGISDTHDKQAKILEALTRKFKLDDNVDLNRVAENFSLTYTGADLYSVASDSMLKAMLRVAGEVDVKIEEFNRTRVAEGGSEVSTRWWFDNAATKEDINVTVKQQDLIDAQRESVPSVSAEEIAHYERVRQNFEGGKEKEKQEQPLEEGVTLDMNGH